MNGSRTTQGYVTKRRPSLASPLPPTPIVPSTPLPGANAHPQSHRHHQPAYQQRPSTATATCSANPSSTRAMMKRLLAKPAPPSSPHSSSMPPGEMNQDKHETRCQDISVSALQPTSGDLDLPPSNEFDRSIRALDLVGQIDISMAPIPSTNNNSTDFLERGRGEDPHLEPTADGETVRDSSPTPGSSRKQRNVIRRKPSDNSQKTAVSLSNATLHYIPPSSESSSITRIGQQILTDGFREEINKSTLSTPTSSTTTPLHPPPLRFPRHGRSKSSSLPTPYPTPQIPSSNTVTNDSTNDDPISPIKSPKSNKVQDSTATPYYTVLGGTSDRVAAAAGPGDALWDAYGGYGYWLSGDKIGEQQSGDGGGPATSTPGGGLTKALTRTVSGKWKKNDSNHQIRSKSSVQELRPSVDKHGEDNRQKLKKSPVSASVSSAGSGSGGGGNSPSRRLWKLMKKISVSGLREKNQADSDRPPPVPPLPNDPFQHQYRTLHTSRSSDSSLVQPKRADARSEDDAFTGLNKVASISKSSSALVSPSLPTTPLGKVHKTAPVPTIPPSTPAPAHHHPKSSPSVPTTGPRPSTTTCSSSPSSDVASQLFNREQSTRSSTSSFGDEVMLSLPKASFSPKSNSRLNETEFCDTSAGRKVQQHIIPPSELIRTHSTSSFPTASSATSNTTSNYPLAIPIPPPPPSMDDDWTIVRSPSVELEALSLPPPPRRFLKGVGVSVGLDHKGAGDQENKPSQAKVAVIPSKMLKMVNMSSEKVDEKAQDAASSSIPSDRREDENEDEDEKNTTPTTTKSAQGDKEVVLEKKQSNADNDSNQSYSPTIPSFSTSSAINSFPARRVSASLSATSRSKGSPIAISPTNSRSSGGGGGSISLTPNRHASSSPSSRSSQSFQRSETRSAFGRVRQQLFGTTKDVHVKGEEEDDEGIINSLPSSQTSEIQTAHLNQLYSPPQQHKPTPRTHHRHSSGSTTAIAKFSSTHAAAATSPVSTSTPTSPIISFHPHRRSMSFNTSSPGLGLFSSARSPSGPFSSVPSPPPPTSPPSRSPEALPLPPSAATSASRMTPPPPPVSIPPTTPSVGHRTRSSSNLRSGFSTKKLSEVLFSSSSSSASPSAFPGSGSASRTRPSSASGHRTMGTFMSRSISIGANNHSNTPIPVTPSQSRPTLTDQEKADKWNDLLARSARAGGTLHLAAGSRLLGSDDI